MVEDAPSLRHEEEVAVPTVSMTVGTHGPPPIRGSEIPTHPLGTCMLELQVGGMHDRFHHGLRKYQRVITWAVSAQKGLSRVKAVVYISSIEDNI